MRFVFLAMGLLVLMGVAATFVLQQVTEQVKRPEIEQTTSDVVPAAEQERASLAASEADSMPGPAQFEADEAAIDLTAEEVWYTEVEQTEPGDGESESAPAENETGPSELDPPAE